MSSSPRSLKSSPRLTRLSATAGWAAEDLAADAQGVVQVGDGLAVFPPFGVHFADVAETGRDVGMLRAAELRGAGPAPGGDSPGPRQLPLPGVNASQPVQRGRDVAILGADDLALNGEGLAAQRQGRLVLPPGQVDPGEHVQHPGNVQVLLAIALAGEGKGAPEAVQRHRGKSPLVL